MMFCFTISVPSEGYSTSDACVMYLLRKIHECKLGTAAAVSLGLTFSTSFRSKVTQVGRWLWWREEGGVGENDT